MYIKIGSLEIRTGKDSKGQTRTTTNHDATPQLGYSQQKVSDSNAVSTVVRENKTFSAPPSPPPAQSGLALYAGRNKPHPMIAAIEWPDIPADPMDQTRLSILINQTDKWFRENRCVDVCLIRDYASREGITLYGDAKEAMDMLHEIHCVDFSQLHPTVLRSIPAMYTEIFKAARGEFNVNAGWRF